MQLTANQQSVLTTLQQAGTPLSAYALLGRLRDVGFKAPIQVYRVLNKLAKQGLIHRLESLNAYVPCAHGNECARSFPAFAICDHCGRVDEFVDGGCNLSLGRWMKNNAFSPGHLTIEIHGKCSACTSCLPIVVH